MTPDPHSERIRSEFGRTASTFTDRTAGRFDEMDAVGFSDPPQGATVLEVGVGTGAFLSRFEERAGLSVGVDLTPAMLAEARSRSPHLALVVGDGRRLPLRSKSVDLATTAQALHHVPEPVPFLKEMRRVTRDDGRVLVVDQVATERFEEALLMTRLEMVRDPSHAASRSPSTLRTLLLTAGLEAVDEKMVESRSTFQSWMPADEFPSERIEETLAFIDSFGAETGMDFRHEDGELVFTRRRLLLLAKRT